MVSRGLSCTARTVALLLTLGVTLVWSVPADAETDEGEPEAVASADKKGKQAKRELPDYSGRGPREPTPGEKALWVPRILLGPLWLVNEFVLRRPLVAIGTAVEEDYGPQKLAHVMTFGTGDRAGIYPTAFFEFGFRPSIGLTFWANQTPSNDARFRAHFAFGGRQWWQVGVKQRFFLGARETTHEPFGKSQIHLGFDLLARPDYVLFGFGPDPGDIKTRYYRRQIGGHVGTELVFGHLDGIGLEVRVDDNAFGPGSAGSGEVSIEEQFDVASAIPGFDGYTLGMASLVLNLDSRRPRPAGGSGVRLELMGDLATDLRNPSDAFARYGAEVGLFGDLNRRNRVLSLRQRVQLVEPLGDGEVPFTELLTLGGVEELRGHMEDRYRGQSLWLTTLQYTYPVWVFLDGIVFVDVGQVFGHHLEGFDVSSMVLSFGMGLRTNGDRDSSFHLMIAAGTTPFDAPDFSVDSFRLVIGTGRGF
jgi:hypothetical protein